MEAGKYRRFEAMRESFRMKIGEWTAANPGLSAAQAALAKSAGHDGYIVETPVVYNSALDAVTQQTEIRIVLVADNPGIQEQKAVNQSYLVGQSGKLAARFFLERLGMDFRSRVVILNKTPVHTPRTAELKALAGFERLLAESQTWMAGLVCEMAETLGVPVWIVGYSELPERKLFAPFSRELALRAGERGIWESLFLFRHFSMNQFSSDFKARALPGESPEAALRRIGSEYREKILGQYRQASGALA